MNNTPLMITDITLINFRCFQKISLHITSSVVLIAGDNGIGKTSLLEALHYACYLRSFRSPIPAQMIFFDAPAFSISLQGITLQESWQLVVGASPEKRIVTLNGTSLKTHKQIFDYYRVITITEYDLDLILGYPQTRRTFLDSTLFLLDTDYGILLKEYAKIVKQRTAILMHTIFDQNAHDLWTEKFYATSYAIQEKRRDLLKKLELTVQDLLRMYCPTSSLTIVCEYAEKKCTEDLLRREKVFRRILFGAHLDDISILYGDTKARTYASRGQQKMLVILFKLAVMQILKKPTVVLLDDFMTDFDQKKIEQLISALIAEGAQIIITCPMEQSILTHILKKYNVQTITLQPSDNLIKNYTSLQTENNLENNFDKAL